MRRLLQRDWREGVGDRPQPFSGRPVLHDLKFHHGAFPCRDPAHQAGQFVPLATQGEHTRPGEKSRILAIGEVKATNWRVGLNQLERLRHIRSLLPASAINDQPKLLLFSRQGFTPDLAAEAQSSPDVALIDLHRLYHGA